MRYFKTIPNKFACAISKFQNTSLLCARTAHEAARGSRSLQEICYLVALQIGPWMVDVFHLRPFCDQKHLVKSWPSLMKHNDLLCEMVEEG
jgi:hypothetical protein